MHRQGLSHTKELPAKLHHPPNHDLVYPLSYMCVHRWTASLKSPVLSKEIREISAQSFDLQSS